MQEQGLVVKTWDDRAEVELMRSKACKSCGMCEAMGGYMRAIVSNPIGATKGSTVLVEIETRTLLGAAAAVYLIPLAFFFVGIFLGTVGADRLGWDRDASGALGGLVLLALSFIVVRMVDLNWGKEKMPKIVRQVQEGANAFKP